MGVFSVDMLLKLIARLRRDAEEDQMQLRVIVDLYETHSIGNPRSWYKVSCHKWPSSGSEDHNLISFLEEGTKDYVLQSDFPLLESIDLHVRVLPWGCLSPSAMGYMTSYRRHGML
jgi:hypothetical protein